MHRPARALVAALAVLLMVTTALVQVPAARGAANGPRWTSGDFWTYADTDGSTVRVEVVGRENVATLLGNIYDAFHVRESQTIGSMTATTDVWIRDSDLGLVRTYFAFGFLSTNRTFDPPQPRASFPLVAGKSWQISLRVSMRIGNGNTATTTVAYGAQVENELDVAVPAGTFRTAVVAENITGSYSKFYFSEQVGYWVKEERYNSQDQKTGERTLTSYRYQWSSTFLAILGTIVAVIAVAVIAFLWRKRKKAVGLPGGPAPPPAPVSPEPR